jgi:hypothetical protein
VLAVDAVTNQAKREIEASLEEFELVPLGTKPRRPKRWKAIAW